MLRLKDAGAVLFHREIWGPRSLLRGQHPGPQIYPDPFPETLERGSRVKLFYETKANLRFEQLATLWKGGVRWIQPGIESFSNPVLRLMKKGTTAFQNIQLLRWCRELGVEPAWNILYGFPGESPSEYARMAKPAAGPPRPAEFVRRHSAGPLQSTLQPAGGVRASRSSRSLRQAKLMLEDDGLYLSLAVWRNRAPRSPLADERPSVGVVNDACPPLVL